MVEQDNGSASAAEDEAPEMTAAVDAEGTVEDTAENAVAAEVPVDSEADVALSEENSGELTAAADDLPQEEPPQEEPPQEEPPQEEPPVAIIASAEAEGAPEDTGAAGSTDEVDGEAATAAATESKTAKVVDGKKAAAKRPQRQNRGKPRRALEEITIGEKINGKVVGLAKFGAFVDIGAKTDGLVHITQFPGRPKTVEEAVKSGDAIEVWVKEVDLKDGRISLTMKEPAENPLGSLLPGAVVQGTVTSVTQYGIFVDISSETEGLVHISEMSSGYVSKPEDIAKPGDSIEVRVKEIDAGRKRISLSMVGLANDTGGGEAPASYSEPEYVPEPESDEPVPTVVELALRKALGDDDDSDKASSGSSKRGKGSGRTDMADLYARMIQDYKQTKAEESGDTKA